MNLTNEEKAKIFAMYLGCEVYTPLINEAEVNMGIVYADVPYGSEKWHLITDKCGSGDYAYLPNYYLKLKSLEDITDEDINSLIAIDWKIPDGVNKFVNGFELVYFDDNDSANCQYIHFNNLTAKQHQFLISRFYAVPLYPYNKTAIELGLAIDIATLTQNQKP